MLNTFRFRGRTRWLALSSSLACVALLLFSDLVSGVSNESEMMVEGPVEKRSAEGHPLGLVPENVLDQSLVGAVRFLFMILEYPAEGPSGGAIVTPQQALESAATVVGTISSFSYGQASVTVDVTPVLSMPGSWTYYQNNGLHVRVRADAVWLAQRAGFNVDDYDREIILTPAYWGSPRAGIGTINMKTSIDAGAGRYLIMHELGHSLGWRHANFWHILSGSDPLAPPPIGEMTEYGDGFDLMGHPGGAASQFSPVLKQRAGWLPEQNILPVTASGVYTLQSLAAPPQPGPVIDRFTSLKIAKDSQADYWVFFRGDEPMAKGGVMITKSFNRNTIPSLLYDTRPASIPGGEPYPLDWQDAALTVDRSFVDPQAQIEIRVLQATATEVVVEVTVPDTIGLIDTPPVIGVLSPAAGQTVTGIVDYEATAYDPETGQSNGAGITAVTLYLSKLRDALIDALRAQLPPPNPVASVTLSLPPYILSVDTSADPSATPDSIYAFVVTATDADGTVNTVWWPHIIDNTGALILGDLNCDDLIDIGDIAPFALALVDPAGYQNAHPGCDINRADMNGDGGADGNDVQPFVGAIMGG